MSKIKPRGRSGSTTLDMCLKGIFVWGCDLGCEPPEPGSTWPTGVRRFRTHYGLAMHLERVHGLTKFDLRRDRNKHLERKRKWRKP